MLNIFKQAFNKDGSVNYTRASKTWGIEKNDLYFYFNPDFNLVDPASLVGGVFVAYRLSSQNSLFCSIWKQMTCYHSKDDLVLLHNLITRPREPNWATYDYLIMDSAGKILDKNFSINQTIDENGIIHISSPENDFKTLVYVAERKQYSYKAHFCHGKDFDKLNNYIADFIGKGYIKTPKKFKKGFSKTEEHPFESQPS